MKNLLIVESPAKCKTIQKILGDDFYIAASYGHIIDLEKKGLGVDTQNNFKPNYIVPSEKKKTVTELKKLAKKAEKTRIATDEDREGEAIGRHIANTLGLNTTTTPRIVFHEITKEALENAIKKPRFLNINLVNAQQARRILDRLVGFELSPVLRKKVKYGLSAGRVQSVALKIVVEREREIQNFIAKYYFKTIGEFSSENGNFNAELKKLLKDKDETKKIIQQCSEDRFIVQQVEKKPGKKNPSAPFTTSSLQQEASRKLGFSVSYTMRIAQKLYEEGHITYMRTDSTTMANDARKAAVKEITKKYGSKYAETRQYKTKSNSAQEAHECIRPTNFSQDQISGEEQNKKLYDLIRKRAIASQMSCAKIEKTTIVVKGERHGHSFQTEGEVIQFDGFTIIYDAGNKDAIKLPKLKTGQVVEVKKITATQTYEHHPPRYTEASLVKKLESEGIGRPSTYAPTIATIQKRNYVVLQDKEGKIEKVDIIERDGEKIAEKKHSKTLGAEKKKLFPTDIGMLVTDFLQTNFPEIVDYHFTARVEKEFDLIAQGQLEWIKMLKLFYKPFHKTVELVTDTSERQTKEKILGIDPKTKKTVLARIGKYGPLIQLGDSSDEEKKFAPIKSPHTIENMTLEEALQYLELPKNIGEYKKTPITINTGRFGPYIKWNDMFISIKKLENDKNRQKITLEEAKTLIQEKIKKDKENTLQEREHEKEKIAVKKGRWGLFIKKGKKNIKVPKKYQKRIEKIKSVSECLTLMQELEKK